MRPVRFVHTSDLHLDTSFSASGFPSRIGNRKREAIRGTFKRILREAAEVPVDLILIAGDLFEHDRVTPDTVEFLKLQFESLGTIPVFIAPGNHDPYLPGSPYREESWPANVRIFTEERFNTVELSELGVRVTGFGFTRSRIEERAFLGLPTLPADAWNLVLAHGSDVTRVPQGKSSHAPFTIDEIAGKNVAYCALGHYHQQRRIPNPIDGTEVWYSGIPEGRGWDEVGACGYLLGVIEDGQVRVEGRICNQYPLCLLSLNCDSFVTREQVLEAILQHRSAKFDSNTILRVRLEGTADPRLDLSLSELEERLAGEILHVQWDDRTQPALDFELISEENTLSGRFVRTLNDRIPSVPSDERETYERARLYGAQALTGREVRLR
jgi:DNA repair exonuclease SbcCD nuclease subunit